jgi:hypothetical protein
VIGAGPSDASEGGETLGLGDPWYSVDCDNWRLIGRRAQAEVQAWLRQVGVDPDPMRWQRMDWWPEFAQVVILPLSPECYPWDLDSDDPALETIGTRIEPPAFVAKAMGI